MSITKLYYLSDIQLKDCHFSHWANHDEVWNKRQANDLKSLPRHLPTLEDDSKRADHLGDIKKVPQNGFLMNPQVITENNLFCTSYVKNCFNPEPNSVALEGIFCQKHICQNISRKDFIALVTIPGGQASPWSPGWWRRNRPG